jgi:hypothetical protein
MGLESLLLIVVVVEAVWILSSFFRGAEENQRARQQPPLARGRTVPSGPRPAPSNVDRFLEEVNRRRREAAERQAASATRESVPAARTDPLPARPGTVPRRPSTGGVLPVPGPAREPGRPRRPIQSEPLTRGQQPIEAIVVVENAAPPAGQRVAAPLPAPSAAELSSVTVVRQPAGVSSSPVARPTSLLLGQLLPMVRDRQALRNAILLQEIFGPPLSRRKRAARPTGKPPLS